MPEQPRFDAVKYKETTREQWQNAAEAWHRWISVVRAWAGPATELTLELARVEMGTREASRAVRLACDHGVHESGGAEGGPVRGYDAHSAALSRAMVVLR